MLKKQTVWLLTMLSLMIVLSVYYMSSPTGDDLAYTNQDAEEGDQSANTESDNGDITAVDQAEGENMESIDESEVSNEADDNASMGEIEELFTMTRMEVQDERSRLKEHYKEVVASSTASTDEINKAWQEIEVLEQLSTKEKILEETIKQEKDFEDVLVRSDGENVVITVKAEELSSSEANSIIVMASDEFGENVNIDVSFKPGS